MEKKITIRGKEYVMKHCVRARIIFETITGKAWSVATLTDQYNYMYACLLAGAKGENVLEYDDFLDALDDAPSLMKEYQEFMVNALNAEAKFYTPKSGDGQGKN